MATTRGTPKRRFDHPVIDSDGHFVEFVPAFLDYFRAEVGKNAGDRLEAELNETFLSSNWYDQSPQERHDRRCIRPPFWNVPTKNTLDLATAMLPDLLYERLDEIGSDFAILYPGLGLVASHFHHDEVRLATCRALNQMYADLFRDFADRTTPVAVIPMHTPEEALGALDHAIGELGLKAIVMPSYVQRPISAVLRKDPEAWRYAFWLDTYGIDSEYDYDPVWARCVELGVVPTFHSHSMGWGTRNSISNYVYNHIGHFAAASEAICKSLLIGGVTRRFPTLKFSFLEGGVGWSRSLLSELISHWQKRNRVAIDNYNPEKVDRERFQELFQRYGGKVVGQHALVAGSEMINAASGSREDPALLDDFWRCEIESVEELLELFVPRFYFGCEADDPITVSAFDTLRNPRNVRFNAVYGSDIGHWDVPDMREVIEEASEPLEKGLMSERDFRDFVFDNPVRLWTSLNPKFFEGTVIEQEAAIG